MIFLNKKYLSVGFFNIVYCTDLSQINAHAVLLYTVEILGLSEW